MTETTRLKPLPGKRIVLTRTYSHPVERVWHALTDSAALAEWLMENDFEPRVGHTFQFRTDPGPGFDGIVNCEVLELVERERLVISWRGGPLDTRVTYSVTEVPEGTRLRVEHEGFVGVRARLVRMILRAGLRSMLRRKLPALLDRGEGEAGAEPIECSKRWLWLSRLFSPLLGKRS